MVINDYISPELMTMLGQLLLATFLSALIGWERERKSRAAGLRTYILVCIGSTLFTLVSESYSRNAGPWVNADPTRISAQIVSGIGFLGAGTILVRGSKVRGLTTAAGLWVVAAVGMAVARGGDVLYLSIAVSLIALFVLAIVDRFEGSFIRASKRHELTIGFYAGAGSDAEIVTLLRDARVEVRRVERLEDTDGVYHRTVFDIILPPGYEQETLNARLLSISWVRRVEWDE